MLSLGARDPTEIVLAKLSVRKMNVYLMDTVFIGPFSMGIVWQKDLSRSVF